METQERWVKEQLNEKGFITRNECLQNYISRLSAIILSLKNEGYEFVSEFQKTPKGKDYIYTLTRKPNEQNQLFKSFNLN
jgi:hypothetical protein